MCILIHHPAGTQFSHEQLLDFFTKNSDGFGAIVKRGDTVEVIKSIGEFKEINELYLDQVAGHESVIHFRMKTHGKIDIANCHPYEVVPSVWMAHNGILSTGNHKDPKMSDTWHYIQDFLKPLLEYDPRLIHNTGFQKMIGSHIGASNKFAFMNGEGEVVLINEASGVWHEEIWYSNTYAWTPWKFGYGQRPAPVTNSGYSLYDYESPYGGNWRKNLDGEWERVTKKNTPVATKQDTLFDERFASSPSWKLSNRLDREIEAGKNSLAKTKPRVTAKKRKAKKEVPNKMTTAQVNRVIRSSYNAVQLGGFQGAMNWVDKHPMAAMNFIYEFYGDEHDPMINRNAVSNLVNHDPGAAADIVCDIWEQMEPELCEMAGIQLEGEIENV
jgi:glutamine amidotransferase